jgi:hypothetical protein
VPRLSPYITSVIACVGQSAAVDAVAALPFAVAGRVAPDEALLLIPSDFATEFHARAAEAATAIDPDAIVVDTTDGWAGWTLAGPDARDAFGRLSAVPLSPGFSQGDVAHVPVKIFASDEALDLLVPAIWGAYLRERILARCDRVVSVP